MKLQVQLGKAARGRRANKVYKTAGNRAERRRIRQLVARELQFAVGKRRYLDYY